MNYPRTVEEVIMDFKGRRAGIIKALIKDVQEFYRLCDPNSPNLCLYGFPNQQWEVNLPPPSEIPEPRLGINFVRDAMTRVEWLSMVAMHSDAWLHAVASYFAAKFKFDRADRKRLFNKITDFPSVCEVIMGGGARKRAKTESGCLPEDMLVEEILSRLPVRDLIRYRSVCKKWRSLIDDPYFVSIHLSSYKSNTEESQLLVMERPRSWLRNEQVLVRRSDTFRKVTEVDNLGYTEICHLVGKINGLILVREGSNRALSEIILWNSSINKSLQLPDSIFPAMREATYVELGLGFDASQNDYKVVAIIYPHAEVKRYLSVGDRYRATVSGLVHVYTLGTNCWTNNLGVHPPPYWITGPQVFVNGAIHWTSLGPSTTDDSWNTLSEYSYLVSFNVGNEVFNYLELPRGLSEPLTEKFPTIMEGSLAMFCLYSSHEDIWVMKEYGKSDSWSKCYTFILPFDKILHFMNNGEVLFALDGKGIKSYDVKRKRVRDLAKTYSRTSKYTIYTHMESLLLLRCK